ncbi:hypothetical protein ACXZ9C_10485 [Streptococcus agalactiae]
MVSSSLVVVTSSLVRRSWSCLVVSRLVTSWLVRWCRWLSIRRRWSGGGVALRRRGVRRVAAAASRGVSSRRVALVAW